MLEVRLIGNFDIKYDGKPILISSRAAQSLFAYLILTAGTSHRRERLAGMFWPDTTEEKARAYLRHELWRIRKAFPSQSKENFLVADDINITFNSSAEYRFDAAVLENVNEGESIKELINALSVFQGELLPGFYDDWVTQEREHLQAAFEKKISYLLELLEKEKRWHDILEWAERWISFGQEPEVAYRYLMTAYDALGDQVKVASTYERCVKALGELDLEPSEQTRALVFKRSSKLNIPIPLTSFIGREKELKEITGLFSKSRLITLTGSGGVGKTRLAIQVVGDVLDMFPDGVWFLDLAPLSDPALVPNTLAGMLGLRESGESPLTDLLVNYLRSRTALVIFDNCEHLIEACAQLVHSLLASCEHFSILATSREALRVAGEIPYRVPSLELPKPDIEVAIDEISNIESVNLFAERAAVALQGFAMSQQNVLAIAQICRRLDGIPLAIELAAARVNMLTVEQILMRLDDQFNLLTNGPRTALPRYQTLRATIEWSYNLLSEAERLLFRRLAVFSGGWTLEAAEAVCCGNGLETSEILDLLSQLVNKSLVIVKKSEGDPRYRRLETIRQFAREKLMESSEQRHFCNCHLKYFSQLTEQAEPVLRGPTQLEWYARLYDERDNIRAALGWADKTDIEAGLSLPSRMERFWEIFDLREGSYWLSKFLQKPESRSYPRARAKALHKYGWILVGLQQFDTALSVGKECLDLYSANGDRQGKVDGLLLLAWETSNTTQRMELTQQALELARSIGDMWRQADALWHLGWLYQGEKKFFYWEKAIGLARPLGDWRWLVSNLSTVGFFLALNGDIESAQKYLDESETLCQKLNIYPLPTALLEAYGQIAAYHGDFEKARAYFQEMAKIGVEFGDRQDYNWAHVRLGYVALREGNLAEARLLFTETARSFQKDKYEIGVVFTLEGIAGLCAAEGKPEHSAQLTAWADATREKIGNLRSPIEQIDVDRIIALCLTKMGKAEFSDAFAEGKKMTLEQAVALELEELQ
jgi:predicted ATPase/DNA-binding SARP family transcriptional activator